MSTITTKPVVGTELHHRYPREQKPQRCFVELDLRTGVLGAAYNPEVGGGEPMDVFHGHRVRWTIPALREAAANDLLAKIAPLAERMVDGYESIWNGNNNVAKLDESAQTAEEDIGVLCERAGDDEMSTVDTWQASEFFAVLGSPETQGHELGITAATTDEELKAIAARELANADDVDIIDGLDEHLVAVREAVRAAAVELPAGRPVSILVIGTGESTIPVLRSAGRAPHTWTLASDLGLDVSPREAGGWAVVVDPAAVDEDALDLDDAVSTYCTIPEDSAALAAWRAAEKEAAEKL